MSYMQTENNDNNNFIVSLEELGLSKYEAGAYLTMIGKGSLAASEIAKLHEKRLKNMKKIIYKLQKVNEEGQRIKGSEERRYFILDPNSALAKVEDLISNSRFSIDAILD